MAPFEYSVKKQMELMGRPGSREEVEHIPLSWWGNQVTRTLTALLSEPRSEAPDLPRVEKQRRRMSRDFRRGGDSPDA